ncbi:MFS transporter [Candidatus Bathyarchaeota archaeon]|nr:MFS transporter [Candidatus Bathyarchaeota archaeon]
MGFRVRFAKENVFLIVCIMGFLAILSSTMSKSPVLPYFAGYLGTSEFWLGLVGSASTIPGILISLPAGSLSDTFGRRRVLLVSAFVFASAPFLYLVINSWWELAHVRFYHGFATGMFVPVAQAMIAEAYPARRGERISLFSSATAVGRSTAPLLGGSILVVTNPGLLPREYTNFFYIYLVVGVVGITALLTTLPFLRQRKSETSAVGQPKTNVGSVVRQWMSIARTRGVLAVSLIEAGQYYVYGSVEFFLVKYMTDVSLIGGEMQSIILFSLVIAVMLSKPLVGRLSDKTGRRTPIILGCIVSGIPLVFVPFFTQFPVLLALAIAYGLGFSMVTSVTPAFVSELVPIEVVGGAMGFISTLMDIGQTLGPLVCGFILGTYLGYVGLFASLALVLMITVFTFVMVRRSRSTRVVMAYEKIR